MAKKLDQITILEELTRARSKYKTEKVVLELFVSGITPKSVRAIEILKEICETYIPNQYSLKIIDIYREPAMAKKNEVFAVPTLIKLKPGPKKVFIGDFSDSAPVLKAFGITKGLNNEK